ncbi:MAG: GIY-YIG nuclease family protein [Rickettsiales bacterium]|jgi:putative endonuclease|nr:GIY-YIG nuclease family protein [Rickettsiales bacterium]
MSKTYYVYILFSHRNGTLYTGVTNDIFRRIREYKNKRNPFSFSSKYKTDQLGYLESYRYVHDAIAREKQIKSGPRENKMKLIESINPDWRDLTDELINLLNGLKMSWEPR